ncbi:MAG: CPBP family intramembrane glutamic endopeptidase [Alkalispirochaetaceae bacterium]
MQRPGRLLALAGAFELSLGVLAFVLGAIVGLFPAERLRFHGAAIRAGLLATVPLLLLFLLFLRLQITPVVRIRRLLYRLLTPVVPELTPVVALLLGLAAGVGEELLFRGFLQEVLVRLVGLTPGILLGAVIFGLLHSVTPFYALYAALLGCFLGLLYHLSGSLVAPIIAHSLYDAVGLMLLRRRLMDR